MWKAAAGSKINIEQTDDGDWETDPDFINNVTEQEQRWGSKTIEGSGRTVGAIDMNKLREETAKAYELSKQQQKLDSAYGYGGKFGIERDRMDKSAVGHDYIAKVEKHVSQTDYSAGFGGKFGLQSDRVDKSAVSWDHKETIEKHTSQKDYSSGFGGKYGIEKDRQDKSAVGWDHVEKLQKHDSQSVGRKDDIIIEKSLKPSELRMKFENLAKQNSEIEIKPRPKPVSIQKVGNSASTEKNCTKNLVSIEKNNEEDLASVEKNNEDLASFEKNNEENLAELSNNIKECDTLNKLNNDHEEKLSSFKEVLKKETDNIENEINANIELDKCDAEENFSEESNFSAIALYDYQAAADDEISFDPDDLITNIEMIDEGWWRGTCHGITGLFPANYVVVVNNCN